MYLKLSGIKGESTDSKHKDEIDLISWSWNASNSGSFHMGPGGGSGKATISDLNIVKYVDASSTELLKCCMNGKHLDEAKLTIRKAGEKPLEYMTITLKKVLVTGVQTSGAQSSDRLQETIALNFAEMKVEYDTQADKGGKGSHFSMGYSIAENKVV
ncbi:MAG: type VI secretion system tube protein Hcp [Nibricoccus sp.]